MKILVTGGAGFIGSHVVDVYIEEGHEVVVIDNLSTGNKSNLNPKATFYKNDIRDDIQHIFEKHKIEVVNHHAAQISVRLSVENPELDTEINVLGLLNILKNCVKYKVKKVINISSAAIFADTTPLNEDSPKKPLSPYGLSKLTAEHYVELFSKLFGIKYITLRYANVYGPRQDPRGEAGVVAIFTDLLKNGKQPTIYGDGKQTRDYIFVKDVVSANLLALNQDNTTLNIGTGAETSVNELFSIMKELTGFSGNPNYADAREGEVLKSYFNSSKAKKLGWQSKYSLKKGLKETIQNN